MERGLLELALLALVVANACSFVRAHGAGPPNVVFIVVDDLGWDDVGFRNNGEIHTPNIDKLAMEGVVLDQYYVQDVCSPSRATFMTGRYPIHNSIVDWIPPASSYGLPLNETTMAQKFKEAGYMSHATGKWHLGFYKWEHTPTFRGFDSFKGFYSGGEDYFSHVANGAYDFRTDSRPDCGKGCSALNTGDQGRYSTTVFSEEAVRIVNSHKKTRPLFLYLAYQGVHSPPQVPEEYTKPYRTSIQDPKRRTFAGMLSAVDEGIGNVTKALKSRGMYENTLVIFTTDNGGPTTTIDGVGARNWPLKGGKHSIWEGGTRGTGVISGAGIPKSRRAPVYSGLMHGADWLPTLADVAGFNLKGTLPLDGVSQWNAITMNVSSLRTSFVYGNATDKCSWPNLRDSNGTVNDAELGCGFGIRVGEWKLIRGYGGAPDTYCNSTSSTPQCLPIKIRHQCPNGHCLYNVVHDPLEKDEIGSAHADVLQRLKERMDNLLKDYHQAEFDKTCPPQAFGVNEKVGKFWKPWC